MAKFSEYVEVEAEIDVSVDDFLSECSPREIEELINAMREDGYLTPGDIVSTTNGNIMDLEWAESVSKLARGRLQLTNEEEELIKKIANRIV